MKKQEQETDGTLLPEKLVKIINLALVKYDSSHHQTIQGSMDEIIGEKEEITYHSLFKALEDHKGDKLFLILGRPGSGKTTIMNAISQDWAEDRILKSYTLVFIQLRKMNTESDHSLETIITQACPNFVVHKDNLEFLKEFISMEDGDGFIFGLDGLDEYTPQYNDFIIQLIRGDVLPNSVVIVTSRPAASQRFRNHDMKQIEVVGFKKDQVKEYIRSYFHKDEEKSKSLLQHLEQHQNLMHMCYLPLHCKMLAFLHEVENANLPNSETEFYNHFTISILLRSIQKRGNTKNTMKQLRNFHQLNSSDKHSFDSICSLAFQATVAAKQIFTSDDLARWKLHCVSIDDGLGLVVTNYYKNKYGRAEAYSFLHLTFQEYLAAVHIAELDDSEQMKIIRKHGNQNHLKVMWRFLCGILQTPSAMQVFNALLEETGDDALFKIQCAHESQEPQLCAHLFNSLKQIKLVNMYLGPSEVFIIADVIMKAKRPPIETLK